jgi:hypothetical protein
MQCKRARHSRHGLNHASHEGGLHFGYGVVDRDAQTFVEDFHAEDLGRAGSAVFVRA